MDVSEFKRIARLLKQLYKEAETAAIEDGIDITSNDYELLLVHLREKTLESLGYTVADYREAKAKYLNVSKDAKFVLDHLRDTEIKIKDIESRHIPTTEEISDVAQGVAETEAKKHIKAPQIINKIIKEKVLRLPQIIKETTTIRETKTKEPDLNPFKEEFRTEYQQFFQDNFSENFRKNINMLGMPDFRKLAIGLRESIDRIGSVNSTDVTVTDSATIDFTLTGQDITASVIQAGIDHGSITGLSDDDHTQYALLLGRSGGQTLIGGTGSGDNLTLKSSSNATKGKIVLGTLSAYDEVNDRLGIGTTSPGFALHIVGNEARFDNSASAGASQTTSIKAGASGTSALYLSDTGSGTVAGLVYNHSTDLLTIRSVAGDRLVLSASVLYPSTSDGIALGSGTNMYSDLFLASGAVINFNNGNVTLTHSAGALTLGGSGAATLALGTNSITMTGSIAATGARVTKGWFTDIESTNMPTVGGVSLSTTFVEVAGDTMTGQLIISRAGNDLDLVNTTDNASVQVAILEGDRATTAANDEAYVSFKLSDSAGNQDEFARLTWKGTTVTSTSEVGRLNWSLMSAGSLVNTLQLTTTALSPTTSDLISLGTSALMFSDGFFADGAVINFNNGNATLTHSAGLLTSSVTMQIPTVRGSSSASGNLQLTPTSNATKGKILLGANSAYDDANTRLGVGTSSPLFPLHISSATNVIAQFESLATSGAYMGSPGYYEADEIGFFDSATDNPIFVTATGSGNLYYGPLGGLLITSGGNVGVGMAGLTTPTRQLDVYGADAATNTSLKVLRLIHETSSTPAANIGVGMEFVVETSASNNEIGVTCDAIATTVTAGSEVFDYRIATMSGGATAATRVWINNTGLGYGITPSAPIHAYQATLGSEVQRLESTATNDDPRESVYQNRVTTTDGTITTLHTFTIPSSTTYTVEANVVARRTGGVSGSAEDGAYYKIIATFKNVAGTATQIGTTTVVATHESQAGWDCVFDVTGATARVRVTGAASNNVTWHMTARVWQVAS